MIIFTRMLMVNLKALKMHSMEQNWVRILLQDDAVADGSQQVVEVELVFVVVWISAMLFPKFNQSFPKPKNQQFHFTT